MNLFSAAPNEFRVSGIDVLIRAGARIIAPENVAIGSHVMIDDFVFIGRHRRLAIGNHVHLATGSSITGGGDCAICDFAGVSSGARILTGTDDFLGRGLTGPTIPTRFRQVHRGQVVIEPHAIIGANAVVLPDVIIGEGATVGAGSIVLQDIEPWSVYVGTPARRVKGRPEQRIRELEHALLQEEGAPTIVFDNVTILDRLFGS
jgi:acetyltransferase-like isoleucine patch superfamily enzyme